MTLGEFIEMTMWYKHINKTSLAKAMGTASNSAIRIINSPTSIPPQKLQKISQILDIPSEVLFMWQGYELSVKHKNESNSTEEQQ